MNDLEKATEFSRRRSIPGVAVRYLHTRRTQDVCLSLCGQDLGSMTKITTRGKATQVFFVLPAL